MMASVRWIAGSVPGTQGMEYLGKKKASSLQEEALGEGVKRK